MTMKTDVMTEKRDYGVTSCFNSYSGSLQDALQAAAEFVGQIRQRHVHYVFVKKDLDDRWIVEVIHDQIRGATR